MSSVICYLSSVFFKQMFEKKSLSKQIQMQLDSAKSHI